MLIEQLPPDVPDPGLEVDAPLQSLRFELALKFPHIPSVTPDSRSLLSYADSAKKWGHIITKEYPAALLGIVPDVQNGTLRAIFSVLHDDPEQIKELVLRGLQEKAAPYRVEVYDQRQVA